MTAIRQPAEDVVWYALPEEEAAQRLDVDLILGLSGAEVERRPAAVGVDKAIQLRRQRTARTSIPA